MPLKSEDTTNYLVQNYNSCIYEVKRLIGNTIREKEINELRKRLSFRIITPHSNIYDKKENFPEIKIENNVNNAEQYLKKKITKFVITVPANFDNYQRALKGQVAEALNLKVL